MARGDGLRRGDLWRLVFLCFSLELGEHLIKSDTLVCVLSISAFFVVLLFYS